MKLQLAAALLLLAPRTAHAHRLDEYLQGTLISLGKDRLQAEITLTPGVAVYPMVAAKIDTDADGTFSDAEQRIYVRQVLRDVSLTIDGYTLTPQLLSMRFPDIDTMKRWPRFGSSSRPICLAAAPGEVSFSKTVTKASSVRIW